MALEKSGVQLVAEGYQQYLNQMRGINKAHQEAFSNKHIQGYKQGQKQVRQEVEKTQGAVTKFRLALTSLGKGDITGALKGLQAAFASMRGAILPLAGALGLLKLLNFAKQSVEVAARNETLAVSLSEVSKQMGYTSEQIAYATEQLKDQGITTQAARQGLLQMAQANISFSKASDLARIAQSAAVIAGENSSATYQRIVTAIQRGEIELLKTVGINVSFANAYKKTAQELGKTGAALTEQEKLQARVNAVMDAGVNIYGVYDEAMSTAGKQQASLARHIEETQNNIGNMLLPLKTLSIEMQTNFWKSARNVTTGMQNFGAALQVAIDLMKDFGEASEEAKDGNISLGKALHNAGRALAQVLVINRATVAGIRAAWAELVEFLDRVVGPKMRNALQFGLAAASGDIQGALKAIWEMPELSADAVEDNGKSVGQGFAEGFKKSMLDSMKTLEEKFPDLFKDFEDIGKVPEVDLDPVTSAIDENVAKLQERKEALERQIEVLKRIEDVESSYRKAVEKANESYAKQIAKLEKDLAKAREAATKKMTKALEDLEKDAAKERAKVLEESRKEEVEAQKDLYKDLEQERRRFELSQLQSLRRFKLSEKRLQAEGDILGLIQLREDFDLQKKEAKENHEFSQKEQKQAAEEQLRKQREDVEERLQELGKEVQERRAEIQQSYKEELEELVVSNQERKAEALASYQEQLQDLKENRAEQLKTLAKSLADEAEITDKGMQEVADKIREVFGEDELADELLYAWAYRSQSVMGQAMEDIRDQIVSVEEAIRALESGEDIPESRGATPHPRVAPRHGRRGMRSGGTGEVIGPALFEVEPGVRERVAFAPVGASTRNQLDVNVAGGIDVRGAEGASPGIVDAAVEQVMSDFSAAVRRLTKR